MEESQKYLRALVLLQLASADEESNDRPEILLERAGFTAREIAELLGKKPNTVAKALRRAKGG